jgi:acetyl/propionyl-CoA carboxylase alpha subunit
VGENNGSKSNQSQQRSTTSGGGTSAQIVGDGNTVNIQQHPVDRGGSVVAVYMRGSALTHVDLRCPTSERPLTVAHVLDVHVQPGETVQPGTPLVEVDVGPLIYARHYLPSPVAGVVEAIHVAVGDRVSQGYLIATVRVWESK